jgi:uncharacterized protein
MMLGMMTIPLFPLNTVLFPGMPLTLHIFEERYKKMMQWCISEGEPFGVVLIQAGQEVGAPATPQPIGCTAEIANVQPLSGGRLNLVAIGQQRFEIVSLDFSQPYLVGTVEPLGLTLPTAVSTPTLTGLRRQFIAYLELLSTVGEIGFNVDKLPHDPLEMAFLTATLLQMPNEKKQTLLSLDNGDQLLGHVYEMCREETAVLRAMIAAKEPQQVGPFSLN